MIVKGLQKALSENIHKLDSFFNVTEITVHNVKKKVETVNTQSVVFCQSLNDFIHYIKEERQLNNVHLKFGIDGEGGYLKVCCSMQNLSSSDNTYPMPTIKRRKFADGIRQESFREAGVNELFILAHVPGTQENYENVK